MRHISVKGKMYYVLEIDEDAVSNEEHFKSDLKQLIEHYVMILPKDEVEIFINRVIADIEFRSDFEQKTDGE